MSDVPAGWQPDPEQPGGLRYWDGTQWTEHRQAPAAPPPPAAYPPPGAAPYGAAPGYPPTAGVPFVPTGGPAPTSNNSGCLKWGLIILSVFVVLGIIGAAAAVVLGSKVIHDLPKSLGVADSSDYQAATTSCAADSANTVRVGGTLKNTSDRRQAFQITVTVSASDGTLIGTASTYEPRLGKGTTGNWSVLVFGTIPEGSTPKCEITLVEYRF